MKPAYRCCSHCRHGGLRLHWSPCPWGCPHTEGDNVTAHNRHLLAEGAYKANREAAAREERERIVNHLRRKASEADKEAMAAYDEYLVTLIPTRRLQGLIQGHLCAELRNLADQIENGDLLQ